MPGERGDTGADLAEDARLVAQALAGVEASYGRLIRRHREAVYRLASHYLNGDDDALDVTQESFVAAFANLGRYDPQRPFRAWILRITVNKCHDWGRRRKVRRLFAIALPLEHAHHVADGALSPETALAADQELARLRVAIAALSNHLKEPLLLCTIEGLPQDEVAALLGISRKAVETRLYRARQKLTAALAKDEGSAGSDA